jgi:hypothetical protein
MSNAICHFYFKVEITIVLEVIDYFLPTLFILSVPGLLCSDFTLRQIQCFTPHHPHSLPRSSTYWITA